MQLLWWKMYPQSELDNYKLQVDLLQEKLKRSEENRQQLQLELKQILQKKNEHDKLTRTKMRQKYQNFLDEQRQRNERNKVLMQMLEHIDQQSAALSARSERLKMMKLQYERYFAKLLQTQTTRCIPDISGPTTTTSTVPPSMQVMTSPASIPVLLPTAQTQPPPLITDRKSSQEVATATLPTAPATFATSIAPPMWTLAMATPTQAGLLLTGAATSTLTGATIPATTVLQPEHLAAAGASSDYFSNPLRYMNLMQQQQNQTLQPYFSPATAMTIGSGGNLGNRFGQDVEREGLGSFRDMQEAIAASTLNSDNAAQKATAVSNKQRASQNDNENIVEIGKSNAEVPSVANKAMEQAIRADISASPFPNLNFDKLPHTLADGSLGPTATINSTITGSGAAETEGRCGQTDLHLDQSPHPHSNAKKYDEAAEMSHKAKEEVSKSLEHMLETSKITDKSKVTAPDLRGYDTSPMAQQKANDSWQQQQMKKWHSPEETKTSEAQNGNMKNDGNSNAAAAQNGLSGFSDRLKENSKVYTEPTSTTITSNQSWQSQVEPRTTIPSSSPTKMTIENIENAIYGELVTPQMHTDNEPAEAHTTADGFFKDLIAQQSAAFPAESDDAAYTKPIKQHQILSTPQQDGNIAADSNNYPATYGDDETIMGYASNNSNAINTMYSGESAEETQVYEPSYAPASNYSPSVTVYNATQSMDQYPLTTEGSNVNVEQNNEIEPQLDYSNYDATQYGNYDPNAYPGYTYNEITGQYVADQEYTEPGENATQLYDDQTQLEQQPLYDNNQQQEENINFSANAAAEIMKNITADAEENPPQPSINPKETTDAALTDQQPVEVELEVEAKTIHTEVKPTSILSTADRHTPTNEAQKKKKRVNFVDSSETDDSSSGKLANKPGVINNVSGNSGGTSSESDFDFTNNVEATTPI